MEINFKTTLFLFRRDLRLHDNTALNAALRASQRVIPCFIFDPRQIDPHPWRSNAGLRFMLESLADLTQQLKANSGDLLLFKGRPGEILPELIKAFSISAIYFNRDYTPFSRNRDKNIKELAETLGCKVVQYGDALLHEPEEVLKDNGTPYTVFTPYYNRASKVPFRAADAPAGGTLYIPKNRFTFSCTLDQIEMPDLDQPALKGGRQEGLKLLQQVKNLKNYQLDRDFPAKPSASRLSAHNKFGTLSIREIYAEAAKTLGAESTFVKELYWRDFFSAICFHFPHVMQGAFKKSFDAISWHNSPPLRERWERGSTGFPIVDAGMRELNQTGFMHNRVRMITASFLVKDLHQDWRQGEQYFARHLVDYDPAVNNGNWQWAASTGCDAQPYFRIFNPWLQQEKFDPEAIYIKTWIPELRKFSATQIHAQSKPGSKSLGDYPAPMLDHAEEKVITEELFEVIERPKGDFA